MKSLRFIATIICLFVGLLLTVLILGVIGAMIGIPLVIVGIIVGIIFAHEEEKNRSKEFVRQVVLLANAPSGRVIIGRNEVFKEYNQHLKEEEFIRTVKNKFKKRDDK